MATSTKRQDYGEHIPGARKDRLELVKFALQTIQEFPETHGEEDRIRLLSQLKLIRRDDVWGTLDDRLEYLKHAGASQSLALVWRVLYDTTAASAGSTRLKPRPGKHYVMSTDRCYLFGLMYEQSLLFIEDQMKMLPLDAGLKEINAAIFASDEGDPWFSNYAGSDALSKIQAYRSENPDLLPIDAVHDWVTSQKVVDIIGNFQKQSRKRTDLVIDQAFDDVFGLYLPELATTINTNVNEYVLSETFTEELRSLLDTHPQWKQNSLEKAQESCIYRFQRIAREGVRGHRCEFYPDSTGLAEHKRFVLDLAYSTYEELLDSNPSVNLFEQVKQTRQTNNDDKDDQTESNTFVSLVVPKIMPSTRFEHLGRTSNDDLTYRDGDISESDLISLIPFRGIQYGNWATQAERQEMLNLAYDALNDLAVALEVAPSVLALPITLANGTQNLGLALGARGRGGNAAAHYEATQHVINLTKTKGGGALAHEWMHAYDHKAGSELIVPRSFASDVAGNPISQFVNVLKKQRIPNTGKDCEQRQRQELFVSMLLSPSVEESLFHKLGDDWNTYGKFLLDTLNNWSMHASPVIAWSCDSASRSNRHTIERAVYRSNMRSGLMQRGVPDDAATEMADVWSDNVYGSDWMSVHRKLRKLDSQIDSYQSEFYNNARVLDNYKVAGYWSSPVELFARAGSAVVQDRLLSKGISNGFLDASSNASNYHPDIHKADTNPAGAERQHFGKVFADTLLVEIQKMASLDTLFETKVEVGKQMRMRF